MMVFAVAFGDGVLVKVLVQLGKKYLQTFANFSLGSYTIVNWVQVFLLFSFSSLLGLFLLEISRNESPGYFTRPSILLGKVKLHSYYSSVSIYLG